MSIIPQLTTQRVLRKEILVDKDVNSRQTADEKEETKINKLAESIKIQGLIAPPLLMRISQAGKDYDGKAQQYLLVAGFRRQAALDLLGQDEGEYRLAPSDWGLREAMGANMVENLQREDLTTFDVAMQCAKFADAYRMNGGDVAKLIRSYDSDPQGKKPMSESHVNNMIRYIRKLAPSILKAWKTQHPACTIANLNRMASFDEHAEQVALWKEITEPQAKQKGNKGEGGDNDTVGPTRVRTTQIYSMMDAVKESEKDDDYKRGALDALNWAVGKKARIPGVKWDPAKAQKGRSRKGAMPKEGEVEEAGEEETDAA